MGRAFEFRKARKMKRWSKMAKTFTKIGKDIVIAVKEGGSDPETNARLRAVMQNAKTANMPKENVERAIKNKIPLIALFPYTGKDERNMLGTEALNEDNLVCKAIRFVKEKYKNEIGIMCDVALDPYTSHGHDGLIKSGYILNDETIEVLIKQSLLQAQMGCDILAPSDMMDGRIRGIRKALDNNNFELVIQFNNL